MFAFNPDLTIGIDEHALSLWWQSLDGNAQYGIRMETPHEHGPNIGLLQERLRTVRCVGLMQTVESGELTEFTTISSWHQQVARLAGSAALRTLMRSETIDSLRHELASIFSPAEATAFTVSEIIQRAARDSIYNDDSHRLLDEAERLLAAMHQQEGPVDDLMIALQDEITHVLQLLQSAKVGEDEAQPSTVARSKEESGRLIQTYQVRLARLQKYVPKQ